MTDPRVVPTASAKLIIGPTLYLADLGSADGACIKERLCRWPLLKPSKKAIPMGQISDLQSNLALVSSPQSGMSQAYRVFFVHIWPSTL